MGEQEEKEWYTSAEAAAYLGINGLRLGRLRREGRIKGIVGGGENPRYAMYHISELKRVDTRDMRKGKRVKREKKKGDEPLKNIGDTHVFHRARALARVG